MTKKKKKVIRNFGRENGHFVPEKIVISEILASENFFRPPKLGARSPPLCVRSWFPLIRKFLRSHAVA